MKHWLVEHKIRARLFPFVGTVACAYLGIAIIVENWYAKGFAGLMTACLALPLLFTAIIAFDQAANPGFYSRN